MDKMGGYTGDILRVNLTTKRITREDLNMDLAKQFVGGRGLNLKYLYDEIEPGIDPLGPDNKIIIGVGPCNGTMVPGSQRFTITTKSPLTGFIGDSNSGGEIGAEIKYAGYDMIIIEGQSERPVYLWINDDKVELKKADHLWSKTTNETRRAIEVEVNDPDACVISIGPGGENLVKFANVIADLGRGSGRAGTGAVFGSKKLKAIAVRGTGGVKVVDYPGLRDMVKRNQDAWVGDSRFYEHWSHGGPANGWYNYIDGEMLGIRNYQGGIFTKDMFAELGKYFSKHKSCISCPVSCNNSCVIRAGKYAGLATEAVELSGLGDPGPKIGNDDIELCLYICKVTDDYGIDLIDTTALIAFVMECYERGILTESELDGPTPQWGDAEAVTRLIDMIAYRQGIGAVLAEGMKRAPQIIGKGSEKYAMHSKGMSLVMREPRASKGWGLGYALSSRGACHMRAAPIEGKAGRVPVSFLDPTLQKRVEGLNNPTNCLIEEGKPEMVTWFEELHAFEHSMEICVFSLYFGRRISGHPDDREGQITVLDALARFYNSVTGGNITPEDLLTVGERITNLERAFNVREGLTRSDDTLPGRVLNEPLPDGRGAIDLEPMVDRYYELRGWDIRTGFPKREKLIQLGLTDVAEELAGMSRLG